MMDIECPILMEKQKAEIICKTAFYSYYADDSGINSKMFIL